MITMLFAVLAISCGIPYLITEPLISNTMFFFHNKGN
uniref:Uncharacterized protein n=1 Tax=Anguilla anguilla TaxID=7936 RepID=A0A0E9XAY8_ANGAN